MNYHPLFFTVLLLGSINLRFNLFYNNDLLNIHDRPLLDWCTGTIWRFVASAILSLCIVAITPITLSDFDQGGPMLSGLFTFSVLGNCIMSWLGILQDDELDWQMDGCPNSVVYGAKRLTPCWLFPTSILSAGGIVMCAIVQVFL